MTPYTGAYTAVKRFVAAIRPAEAKPYEVRFETPPGQQAQVDFAHFVVTFEDAPHHEHRRAVLAGTWPLPAHRGALCGFRFEPRIPNLSERRLHAFAPAGRWPTLEPFLGGRIDEALITRHWDDLLRLATSVRVGSVPASLMLRRFGSYRLQNGLAWRCGNWGASSAPCSPSTGWRIPACADRRARN